MLTLSGRFYGKLKTVICVENYVETRCRKFQCALKLVKHVENYVKISRCVENVYVRHVENHAENLLKYEKKHHHTLWCVLKLSSRFHFSSSILHTFLGSYICLKSQPHTITFQYLKMPITRPYNPDVFPSTLL